MTLTEHEKMTLKNRFLEAISRGDLGEADDFGIIVSLKEFKLYFNDVKSDYVNSFLPAAVIETGQRSATHTRFVFRVKKGIYRVHPDVIPGQCITDYPTDISSFMFNNKVEEPMLDYLLQGM